MEGMDKTQRFKQTVVCEKCGEEFSVTYKRCPFCGGSSGQKRSGIDIQGPELYDQPVVPVRPSAPIPSAPPVSAEPPEDFTLDIDFDFTPDLEDETSSVPKPPPGSTGGKRLASKGSKAPKPVPGSSSRPPSGGASKPAPKNSGGAGSSGRGAARAVLLVLSLLIIAAAIYIVATKAMPLINTFLDNRAQNGVVDDNQGENNTPIQNEPSFTLTKVNVVLPAPGATEQLIPIYEPPEEVGILHWSSDNPEVVTVSEDGKLTAVSIGSATITVTHEDGLKALCAVECVWDDATILENLTLNKVDFTLRSSDPDVQMKVIGYEGTPPVVVWASENPNVASISESGLVKWVGAGSTKVTATINGTTHVLECTVRCN